MTDFEVYKYHNRIVSVREDLKGRHREHCLCYSCQRFDSERRARNCDISNKVFDLCAEEELVLPVWECPLFIELDRIKAKGG